MSFALWRWSCAARGEQQLLALIDACLWNANPETMEHADVEIYKVWPTFRDLSHYKAAMEAENIDELRVRFPRASHRAARFDKRASITHPRSRQFITSTTKSVVGSGSTI